MELKDWVKRDMSRFVRRHEPTTRVNVPIRHEQATLLNTRDYETQIRLALKHDRFHHACQLFNELKQAFLSLSIDHQEERRQYYRLLQLAYKEIYEFVADKHKTARILEEIQGSDNVFGTTKTGPRPTSPRESIETSMTRAPSLQSLPETRPTPQPAFVREPLTPQPVPAKAKPVAPAPQSKESLSDVFSALSLIKPDGPQPYPVYVPPKEPVAAAPALVIEPAEPTPSPAPEPVAEPTPSPVAQPRPVAEQAPESEEPDEDEELLAARQELERWKKSFTASGARIVRKHPVQEENEIPQARPLPEIDDGEVFSSLYVRGVQAMSQGDYDAAAKLFLRRVQQNPTDRAARIRLTECLEVLDGTITR